MKTRLHTILLALLLSVAPQALLAASEPAAPEPPPAEAALSLWGMIQQGGWAMYPLGACSLAMFFLAFYSWRETASAKFLCPETTRRAEERSASGDTSALTQTLAEKANVLGRSLAPALRNCRPDDPAAGEKAANAFADRLEAEENSVGQWVAYLNVVAAVAPMIGLLGTVSGMISAFQTIGRGGMGRPELLAGDIGEALITTATGLVIGIPAMIAYFVIRNRLNSAVIATSRAGAELIELACRPHRPGNASASAGEEEKGAERSA